MYVDNVDLSRQVVLQLKLKSLYSNRQKEQVVES